MTDKLPKREEVAQELTWRLEDIYDDETKWEEDLKKVYEVSKTIASYQGKLAEGADTLLALMKANEEQTLLLGAIYGYAHMREDQDTANSKYQAMKQRGMSAYMDAAEKSAFMNPEILELSDEKLDEYYKACPELDDTRDSSVR